MTNEEKFKTVEERFKAFNKLCRNRDCADCPLGEKRTVHDCQFMWLALEAEEDKPEAEEDKLMPCPYCGANTEVVIDECECYAISCIHCEYGSPAYNESEYAIAAHNRICRAVKAYKEGE